MGLLQIAGLVADPSEDVRANPTALDRLELEALRFRLAGGVLTLTEYASLVPAEREALAAAGEALQAASAVRTGEAVQGPGGIAAVVAPFDGGRARDRLILRRGLERAAGRASTSESPLRER